MSNDHRLHAVHVVNLDISVVNAQKRGDAQARLMERRRLSHRVTRRLASEEHYVTTPLLVRDT